MLLLQWLSAMILVISIIVALVSIICLLSSWSSFCGTSKDAIKIPFNTFDKWFTIAPDTYSCEKTELYKRSVVVIGTGISAWQTVKKYYIKFNLPQYLKYRIWLRDKIKSETLEKNNAKYKELLEIIQSDIAKFKEQACYK